MVGLKNQNKMQNSKVVYFKDGTSITVEDGVTWEYENDHNWVKTEPIINPYAQLITDLKATISWLCETIEPMLDEKYEFEAQLSLKIDDIKTKYL